jgi:hypothetical protein
MWHKNQLKLEGQANRKKYQETQRNEKRVWREIREGE